MSPPPLSAEAKPQGALQSPSYSSISTAPPRLSFCFAANLRLPCSISRAPLRSLLFVLRQISGCRTSRRGNPRHLCKEGGVRDGLRQGGTDQGARAAGQDIGCQVSKTFRHNFQFVLMRLITSGELQQYVVRWVVKTPSRRITLNHVCVVMILLMCVPFHDVIHGKIRRRYAHAHHAMHCIVVPNKTRPQIVTLGLMNSGEPQLCMLQGLVR